MSRVLRFIAGALAVIVAIWVALNLIGIFQEDTNYYSKIIAWLLLLAAIDYYARGPKDPWD